MNWHRCNEINSVISIFTNLKNLLWNFSLKFQYIADVFSYFYFYWIVEVNDMFMKWNQIYFHTIKFQDSMFCLDLTTIHKERYSSMSEDKLKK